MTCSVTPTSHSRLCETSLGHEYVEKVTGPEVTSRKSPGPGFSSFLVMTKIHIVLQYVIN